MFWNHKQILLKQKYHKNVDVLFVSPSIYTKSILVLKRNTLCNYHMTHNHTPGHLSQENENLRSHKNLYMNVYSSFIRNSEKPETTLKSQPVNG